MTSASGNVDVVVVIAVDVGGFIDLGSGRRWKAKRSSVIVVDVVVDVGFCVVADSDNDIEYDYDGHSRVPPLSAKLSDTPINEGFDIDNDNDIDCDIDCDIDPTVRPVYGLNSLLRETCGAGTELVSTMAKNQGSVPEVYEKCGLLRRGGSS